MKLRTRVSLLLLLVCAFAAAGQEVVIAPDESLPVLAYIEMGVPATDREWTAGDYEKLAKVLEEIVVKNPRQLPRFDSPRSGALMKRAVSTANLAALRDRSTPLEQRMPQIVALTQHVGALTLVYVAASNGDESFDRELVEMASFVAKVSLEAWAGVDEFLETLPPDVRKEREAGLDQVRAGSSQVVGGAITTFGETNVYRPAELVRFAAALEETLPLLLARVSEESRAELLVQLRTAAADAKHKDVAAALRRLLELSEKRQTPRM